MIKYQNAINKLFHINLDKNDIVIADDTVKVNENLLDDNIDSKLRVLNNIETPILNTNEIKSTYDCNILTIGNENNIVNIKDNLSINEESPNVIIDINETDGIKIPNGTTNQRPINVKLGTIRYNSELKQFEGYGSGNVWGSLGGIIDVNKNTFIRAEKEPNANNNELEFYTSNIERMIIKDDGTINIGNGNTEHLLNIHNILKISTNNINVNRNIIPEKDNDLNISSTENKFKNTFISEKGIWLSDKHYLSIYNDNVYFRKRKINQLPQAIINNGGTIDGILTFANKTKLSNIKLFEFEGYMKTLTNINNTIDYIFTNLKQDYEYESIIETWKVNNNKLFLDNNFSNIGIGTNDPKVSLDIQKTDAIQIPKGNINDRPTNLNLNDRGLIRYNIELDQFEGYGAGNAWGSLGGNIDINKDTFIRAEKTPNQDNNELEFYTCNIERMIIKDDGKVGINVSNPTHNLHIKGTTRIEGDLIVNGIQNISNIDTSTTEQLIITNDGTGPALKLNQIGAQPIIEIQDDSNSVFHIKNGGNIGIKNNDPKVSFSINTQDGLLIPKGIVNERPIYLEKGIIRYNSELNQFEGYGAGDAWGSLGGTMDINKDTFIRAEKTPNLDNNELEFYTFNNERMIIKDDGKIGINTNNPSETLDINGNLKISGNIVGNYLKGNNYSREYIDNKLLGLNYNLNRENYKSDKDESIIGWYNFDNKYRIGIDKSKSLNDLVNMKIVEELTNPLILDENIKKTGKKSLKIDSSEEYLKTSKNVLLYDYWLNNGGFSISFWTNNVIKSINNIILGINLIDFVIYYNNKLEIRIGNNLITNEKNITFNLNEWVHHTIVFENNNNLTNVYYYQNGNYELIVEGIQFLINENLNNKLNIGYIESINIEYNFYKGYLDDIRIFNKNLNFEEIQNVYNDVSIFFEPQTLQSLGQLSMNSNKIPIFLDQYNADVLDFLNESNMESDSITGIPTQHSVINYKNIEFSNLTDVLKIVEGSITNNLLASNITDDKLLERYVKTSDLINVRTHTTDILNKENGGLGVADDIITDELSLNKARINLNVIINNTTQKYNEKLESLSQNNFESNTLPIYEDINNFKVFKFTNDIAFCNVDDSTIPSQYAVKGFIDSFALEYFNEVLGLTQGEMDPSTFDQNLDFKEPDYLFDIVYSEMSIVDIGAVGTPSYDLFTSNLLNDISVYSGISLDNIEIEAIESGSLIFKLKVKSTKNENAVLQLYNMKQNMIKGYINPEYLRLDTLDNLTNELYNNLLNDIIYNINSYYSNQESNLSNEYELNEDTQLSNIIQYDFTSFVNNTEVINYVNNIGGISCNLTHYNSLGVYNSGNNKSDIIIPIPEYLEDGYLLIEYKNANYNGISFYLNDNLIEIVNANQTKQILKNYKKTDIIRITELNGIIAYNLKITVLPYLSINTRIHNINLKNNLQKRIDLKDYIPNDFVLFELLTNPYGNVRLTPANEILITGNLNNNTYNIELSVIKANFNKKLILKITESEFNPSVNVLKK